MELEAVTKRHMHQGSYECREKNTVVPGNEDGRQIKKNENFGKLSRCRSLEISQNYAVYWKKAMKQWKPTRLKARNYERDYQPTKRQP